LALECGDVSELDVFGIVGAESLPKFNQLGLADGKAGLLADCSLTNRKIRQA
jgi:hypothetical protein